MDGLVDEVPDVVGFVAGERTRGIANHQAQQHVFLTGLHARGGYHQEGVMNDLWAVTVDVVSVAFLIWVASGLYIWWQLRSTRRWGMLAIGGGFVTMIFFVLVL